MRMGQIRLKPVPTLPFEEDEMQRIIEACDRYSRRGTYGSQKRDRMRALTWPMRYSGLRIRDSVTCRRDRLKGVSLVSFQRAATAMPNSATTRRYDEPCIARDWRHSATWWTWLISAGRSSSSTKNWKKELGLDHFEGRSLRGWEHDVVLTALAYGFLQGERRQRRRTRLTLLHVRAVVQDVLTAHFFITQPNYLKWMLKLKDVDLRI
jgi:hypothetical protein